MTAILDQDLGDPYADITSHDTYLEGFPHAAFIRLREEDPVSWVEEGDGSGFWAVTKHADVVEVSRDFQRFTAARGIRIEEMDTDELEAKRSMMEHDPPEHTRLRRLVSSGFTPKVVATYEEAFRRLVNRVLDKVLPLGSFDLVTEEYRLLPFRSPAALEVFRYAEELAQQRRADPEDDIISTLLTAEPEGEPLTDLEFKNFFTLLMVAGNETTRHTISHALVYLESDRDQLEWWRQDLTGRSEVASEEILRASSVTMHFRRTAAEDTEIRGTPIAAGDRVVIWYTSANYDSGVFDEPFEFSLARDPNPHVTFGTGRHVCLGASLARLEVRVFFEEFLRRVSDFSVGEPDRLRSNFIR